MQNFNTLWMPGTDTQASPRRQWLKNGYWLKKVNADGFCGARSFVTRVQAWKDEYEAKIINQLQAMGCSCDWQRTRFTMDEVCAKTVRRGFFQAFQRRINLPWQKAGQLGPATQTVAGRRRRSSMKPSGAFLYLRYLLVRTSQTPLENSEYVTWRRRGLKQCWSRRPMTAGSRWNPAECACQISCRGENIRLPNLRRHYPRISRKGQ